MIKYKKITNDEGRGTHLYVLWPLVLAVSKSVSGTWSNKSQGIEEYDFIDFTPGEDHRGKWLICIFGRYMFTFLWYKPQ